jgi:squalene cyclase
LYIAVRNTHRVPPETLTATSAWLSRPERWNEEAGNAEFKDDRLARIQFAAALAEAAQAKRLAGPQSLKEGAALLAKDQSEDGSWPLATGGVVAAPATYGPTLATHLARRVLEVADASAYREHLARSQQWLEQAKPGSVLDNAAVLWALARVDSPAAGQQRRRAIDLLRRAQSQDGGWGPYATLPPEPFDTAIALLALKALNDKELEPLISRGRTWLVARQQADGSWPATTRPAGVDSYAQYISTTAWALQALLATQEK